MVYPTPENPVRLDIFQEIVDCHFGSPYITAEFRLLFYGPGQLYSCFPDTPPYGGVEAQYDYWWTSLFLRGWKYGTADGLQFIDGMDVSETNPWSWSGIPTYPEDTIAAQQAHAWNDIALIDNPLVNDNEWFQTMIFTPLAEPINSYPSSPVIEFQYWHPKWVAGPWCDSGVEWKAIDDQGFLDPDGEFFNYEDPLGHNQLILSQTIDFSTFQVTNSETGKTYQAVAANNAEFATRPHSRFSLMMKQV
jgi:hypothetical protein